MNQGPLSDNAIKSIFREIMSASIALQKPIKIGYLGPFGTFSHQAANKVFGDSVQYDPKSSIAEVFKAVSAGDCHYGIVPFENSIYGIVPETLDQMRSMKLKIRSQVILNIQHCLLSNSPLASIKRVYSHHQALGQCQKWLNQNLKGVEQMPVASSAQAVELAAKENNTAAIASAYCSDYYGVQLLENGIQDEKGITF
jgi:chorismate mutase/prephenate dehydratase